MQNKSLVTIGAIVLILIVAAASFSTGLYLGQRGFVSELQMEQQSGFQPGPGGQAPVGQFPNGQQPQQGGGLLQGGQPSQNGGQPQSGFPQGSAPQSGPNAGQPSQGGFNPTGGPPGAPSWPPDVMGRLVSITATELVLDTPNGQVTVTLDSSTQLLGPDGAATDFANFQAGDVIAVFGTGTAASIMELPPRPNNAP